MGEKEPARRGGCAKWLANAPTSAHWYTADQLRNLIAAYVAAEEYGAPARTVREFIAEFRGLSATAKQKAILERLNLAGVYLHDLVQDGDIDRVIVSTLLAAMQAQSKPIKPAQLGMIGEDHIKTWLEKRGAPANKANTTSARKQRRDWRKPFLAALALTCNVKAACEAAHVSRPVAYKRRTLADMVREDWQPRSWGDCIDALRAIGAVYGPHIRAVFRAQLAEGREPRTAPRTWIED